jgi:hypothetical protein
VRHGTMNKWTRAAGGFSRSGCAGALLKRLCGMLYEWACVLLVVRE